MKTGWIEISIQFVVVFFLVLIIQLPLVESNSSIVIDVRIDGEVADYVHLLADSSLIELVNGTLTLTNASSLRLEIATQTHTYVIPISNYTSEIDADVINGALVLRLHAGHSINYSTSVNVESCSIYKWLMKPVVAVEVTLTPGNEVELKKIELMVGDDKYLVPRTLYRLESSNMALTFKYECSVPFNYLLTSGRMLMLSLEVSGSNVTLLITPLQVKALGGNAGREARSEALTSITLRSETGTRSVQSTIKPSTSHVEAFIALETVETSIEERKVREHDSRLLLYAAATMLVLAGINALLYRVMRSRLT